MDAFPFVSVAHSRLYDLENDGTSEGRSGGRQGSIPNPGNEHGTVIPEGPLAEGQHLAVDLQRARGVLITVHMFVAAKRKCTWRRRAAFVCRRMQYSNNGDPWA